jgi:hypothetical protein
LRWDTVSSNAKDRTRHGTNHLANRTHCPRQHSLAAPNLVPSTLARGYRDCLACSRARGYGQIAKRYGRPFNFEEAADKYYAAIMKEHHVGVGLRA